MSNGGIDKAEKPFSYDQSDKVMESKVSRKPQILARPGFIMHLDLTVHSLVPVLDVGMRFV